MKIFLIILVLFLFPIASFGESSCRCGKDLVSIGDTKVIVKAKCGKPDSIDREELEVYTKRKKDGQIQEDTDDKEVTLTKYTKVIETWTYNMGANRLIRYLNFQNGELIKIETGEKGRD